MSISRRKDGRWCVKYKIDTPTGQKWTQKTFPKDKEAEARAFELEAKYDEPENTRPTLLECVLAYVKEVPHCDFTSRQYENLVCGYDRKDGVHTVGPAEFLADKFADSLDKRDLLAFRDTFRARGVAEATVALGEQRLKAALRWCADEGLIPEHPWAKHRGARVQHKSRQGSLEDLQKVYACLPEWMQWASRTAMALCVRPGITELFSLRWRVFDWKAGTATVYMGKVKSSKTVYVPGAYLAEARERFESSGCNQEGLVCPGRRGQAIRPSTYDSAWRTACGKAGISIPMYAIRHISATEMLANGVDLAAVAAQLGHRNLTTTGQYYAHALARAQREAAKALPSCTTFGADGAGSRRKNQ